MQHISPRLIACSSGAALLIAAATSFPQPPPSGTLPFRFVVRNVEVRTKGQAILADTFRGRRTRVVPPTANNLVGDSSYWVNLGRVGPANIRDGLVLDQTTAETSMWNVTATMVTLPVGPNGTYTFSGDRFPLEVSATIQQPRIKSAEKFMVGITDLQTLHAVAVLSIGIPGIPGRPPIIGGGGGGGGGGPSKDNFKNRVQQVVDPAFMLMREEEPEIREHIVLDNVAARGINTADSVTMTVRIGEDGAISGVGRVVGGQQPGEFTLTPKIDQEFAAFYRARQRLDPKGTKYTAMLYAENLPRVRVFAVDAPVVGADAIRAAGATVPITLHGVGFGLDSKVEIVPVGGGQPARVSNIQVGNLALLMTADVAFPEPHARSYQVRVTSAGQVATMPLTIRLP